MKRGTITLLLAALALALGACGSSDDDGITPAPDGSSASTAETTAADATTTTEAVAGADAVKGCTAVDKPAARADGKLKAPTEKLSAAKTYTVTLKTNCGDVAIRLDVKRAPKTAASFASLVEKGFYDDLTFHRIVPGFVVQGGDPLGTGTGGSGYKVTEAPPSGLKYTKGIVAMAKGGDEAAGTSGSQFFIVTGDDVGLPPEYALVGTVTSGMDAVKKMEAAPVGSDAAAPEAPDSPLVIEKATLAVK